MDKTMEMISTPEKFESDTVELFSKMFDVRITSFEDQLSKLETI